MFCILEQSKSDLYTYESVRAVIDYQYQSARSYFLAHLWIYILWFMLPFSIELYYMDKVMSVPS